MNKKQFIAAAAALGVAASLVAVAPAAYAEPVSPGFAAVGSDTLQDVVNALSNGTKITTSNVRSTAKGQPFANFDATGSATIQTKSLGARFTRPNGSSEGILALSRSIDGGQYKGVVITGQVDIARSSSKPAEVTNGGLYAVPFGRDAIAYAHTGGSNPAFDGVNKATLKGIFECTITTLDGTTVVPVIPQDGSGTRKDFLKLINVTTPGACVVIGQEHDTKSLANGTAFPANAITPMSAAQWVAQNTGAGTDRRGSGVELGTPIAGVAPVTGTGTSMVPNAAYYNDDTWGRDTFLLVEYARVEPGNAKYDGALADLVATTSNKLGNVGSAPNQAGGVKKKFGFLAPKTQDAYRAAVAP